MWPWSKVAVKKIGFFSNKHYKKNSQWEQYDTIWCNVSDRSVFLSAGTVGQKSLESGAGLPWNLEAASLAIHPAYVSSMKWTNRSVSSESTPSENVRQLMQNSSSNTHMFIKKGLMPSLRGGADIFLNETRTHSDTELLYNCTSKLER